MNNDANDWDIWYNWNADGDYEYYTFAEFYYHYDATTTSFAVYSSEAQLFSKDLNKGASKNKLGLRPESNVTV